ncbi:MAG: hypothetical protein ACJ8B6_00190, partial [Gemmatimonadales bacterium]
LLFAPWDTPETVPFFRVRSPDSMERLGSVPRSVENVTFSDDLSRTAVLEVARHGDAFMSKLVRP